MLADPLNVRGKFSDGYDGRLDAFERVTEMGKGELGTQTVWMAHPK